MSASNLRIYALINKDGDEKVEIKGLATKEKEIVVPHATPIESWKEENESSSIGSFAIVPEQELTDASLIALAEGETDTDNFDCGRRKRDP